jgi:hypothetical protein
MNNCDICKKQYKNYNSLWSHNKNYHKIVKNEINKLECIYCKKIFTETSNRYRHQKLCKKNTEEKEKQEKKNIEEKEEQEKKNTEEKEKKEEEKKKNIIKINEQALLLKDKEIELKNKKIELLKLKNDKIIKIENNNNNNIIEEKNIIGYIYIIHEREFIKCKENVYKIGRTEDIIKRIKKYPKNSCYCFTRQSNNMFIYENKLIKLFKDNFIHQKDYGNEYFKGDIYDMIKVINGYLDDIIEKNKVINNIVDNNLIEKII